MADQPAIEGASRELARRLGFVGIWTPHLHDLTSARAAEVLATIEDTGVPVVWIGEGASSKEIMTHSAVLLSQTRDLVIATGIATIHARDPLAMSEGGRVLSEAYPNRFVLGLGASHTPNILARHRGKESLGRPLSRMRRYLDEMDAADRESRSPGTPPPRVLAALRPGMLRLAAERTLGAHPFFVTVEHTARAREILGPDPVLAPELAVVLETDRSEARAVAAEHVAHRLDRENYRNNLLWLGFSEADLDHGGSDRLFDDVIAWGNLDDIAARVRAYIDAGADHVAVDIIARQGEDFPLQDFLRLAPVLFGRQAANASRHHR